MKGYWLSVVFATLYFLKDTSAGLKCLQCTDSPFPRDCGRTTECGPHEVCYIEQFATRTGMKKYNLGCMDRKFCKSDKTHSNRTTLNGNSTSDAMMRSSSVIKMCDSCCDTHLCNSGGCGAVGFPSRPNRGPICYTCAQQLTPGSCDSISLCGLGSVCKLKVDTHLTIGDLFYTTSCENKQVCHQEVAFQEMIVGRKRSVEEVVSSSNVCVVRCCDGDLCNGECGTHPEVTTTAPNACLSNPCVHGTCTTYGSSFTCSCQTGYSGTTCAQVLYPVMDQKPFLSNPFVKPGTFEFCCLVDYNATRTDVGFDVTWLFDGKEDPKGFRESLSGFRRASCIDQRYLAGHMGESLSCSVSPYFLATSSIKGSGSVSNSYWMGIKTSPSTLVVGTNEPVRDISVISTIPIACNKTVYHACRVYVDLEPNNHNFSSASSCAAHLTPQDWNPETNEAVVEFSVAAERTPQDAHKKLVLAFRQLFWVDSPWIFYNYTIPYLPILPKNNGTTISATNETYFCNCNQEMRIVNCTLRGNTVPALHDTCVGCTAVG